MTEPTKEAIEETKKVLGVMKEGLGDAKFEEEKKQGAIRRILHLYRDTKIILPRNKFADGIEKLVQRIDPHNTMSERELVKKIVLASPEFMDGIWDALQTGTFVSEPDLKKYAEQYHKLLKSSITDTTAATWDAIEYFQQQLMSILNLSNVGKFSALVKQLIDEDPKCPYVVKKFWETIAALQEKAQAKIPTDQQEKLAEEIMGLVDEKLEKDRPDIFRALVNSLKWRPQAELDSTLASVKKTPLKTRKTGWLKRTKGRGNIRGRESCIFIEHADGIQYVG